MSFIKGYARKLGVLEYLGTWNASTNSPALASGVGQRGGYYIVSASGNTGLDGITDWNPGDWAIFSGQQWQKLDSTDKVTSVNGETGDVLIPPGEIDGGEADSLYGGNGTYSGGGA